MLTVNAHSNGVRTELTYNAAGQLSRMQHLNSSNSSLLDLAYAYDSAGQLVQQTEDTVTIPFGYDAAGQLTSATYPNLALEWTYDSAGNRLTEKRNGVVTAYTVNAANQLTQVGSANISYDSSGNMISSANGETLTWDADNRLTKYESGAVVVTFNYANDWRTISRNDGTLEQFAYAGDNVAARIKGSNLTRYLHASVDGILGESTTVATYHLLDHLMSIRAMTSAAGSTTARTDYDAWGNILNGAEGVLGFTGRPRHADGFVNLRMREYSSEWGRFLQTDPIGIAGGLNLHAYVGNAPTMAIDPYGLVEGDQSAGRLDLNLGRIDQNIGRLNQNISRLNQSTGYDPTFDPSVGMWHSYLAFPTNPSPNQMPTQPNNYFPFPDPSCNVISVDFGFSAKFGGYGTLTVDRVKRNVSFSVNATVSTPGPIFAVYANKSGNSNTFTVAGAAGLYLDSSGGRGVGVRGIGIGTTIWSRSMFSF